MAYSDYFSLTTGRHATCEKKKNGYLAAWLSGSGTEGTRGRKVCLRGAFGRGGTIQQKNGIPSWLCGGGGRTAKEQNICSVGGADGRQGKEETDVVAS